VIWELKEMQKRSRLFMGIFFIDSDPIDKELYVLGGFNDFKPSKENQMQYDELQKICCKNISEARFL
jgi:hypothetical protein